MLIKFKKLHPNAKRPTKNDGDEGWDLYAIEDTHIPAHSSAKIRSGLAIEMSPGYYAELFPRSGLSTKNNIIQLNSVGVIDNNYRGEIISVFYNLNDYSFTVDKGSRFAQLLVKERISDVVWIEVGELTETERGIGGFGSSDNLRGNNQYE